MRIFILIILLFTLTGCSTNLSFVENRVYSESALKSYTDATDNIPIDEYISRSDAINLAYNIIKNGFGSNLDRNSIYEYISLDRINSTYFWSITFTNINSENKESYYIRINSDTGELYEAANYLGTYNKYNSNEPLSSLSLEECKNIIKPLTDIISINLDEYIINTYDKYDGIYIDLISNGKLCYYFFITKSNNSLQFFQKGD